ncbi:MAG: hypothetical protein ABTD50_02740 [Polyangiaceae bacterium]|jgi:hypothetical protein
MLTREEMRRELHDLARLAATMPRRASAADILAAALTTHVEPASIPDAPSFASAPATVRSLPPSMTSAPSWPEFSVDVDFRPRWGWKLPAHAARRWTAVVGAGVALALGCGLALGHWMAELSPPESPPARATAELHTRASLHEEPETLQPRPTRPRVFFRTRR